MHGLGLQRLNFDPHRVVSSLPHHCFDLFMSVDPMQTLGTPDAAVQEVKIHLAAALRMAVLDGFEEGIDNHFTACVPGRPNRYFVLPFGLHWSEAKASDMMIFNEEGQTLEGRGVVELSAQCIHAPLHRLTGAKVVLHTHQPWATALNMLQDNRLLPATQTAAFFHGRIAYDDTYTGLASSLEEGERLAALMGDKTVLFMKNHGVVTIGDTVAQAYRRLYKLEKACQTQVLAMSTGKALNILGDEVIQRVLQPSGNDRHPRGDRERLYFEANMRILDRLNPGYAD
ncbi:class II aldolase/adducin family protein [Limnohabitans sp.]|uniref:class II aldolase/adducin family protein n=1 Tax=Limnohabitans sp. TaxID=1907725 RepID=UPI0039BC76E9